MIEIIKFLNKLKLNISIKKKILLVNNTNNTKNILKIFLNLNIIKILKINKKKIICKINAVNNKLILKNLIIFNKKNIKYKNIKKLTEKSKSIFIFNTNLGFLKNNEINKYKIGGYLIAKINI